MYPVPGAYILWKEKLQHSVERNPPQGHFKPLPTPSLCCPAIFLLPFSVSRLPLSTACVCRASGRACACAAAQLDTRTGLWTEAWIGGRAGSQDRLCPDGNTLGWPAISAPGQLSLRQRPAWFQVTELGGWWGAAGKEGKPVQRDILQLVITVGTWGQLPEECVE